MINSLTYFKFQTSQNPYGTEIKHALNHGEQFVAGYQVDGLTVIPSDPPYVIVFEFCSCYVGL